MKRVRSNALWNKLSPEHLQKLDQWLFDEKLSYARICGRAREELGFEGSESSLKRYSLRRQKERTTKEFRELQEKLVALKQAPADPKTIHAGATKLMGSYLFKRLQDSPDDVEQWGPVARLLMQNNFTEMLREAKAKEYEIRCEAMAFAKKKFQFDMTERALRVLPQLRELAEARKDPGTTKAEHDERLEMINQMMFGDDDDEEEKENLQTPSTQAPEKLQDPNTDE